MSVTFDTAAVRQWAEYDVPDDTEERRVLWAQLTSDVVAACDRIDELEARLAAGSEVLS